MTGRELTKKYIKFLKRTPFGLWKTKVAPNEDKYDGRDANPGRFALEIGGGGVCQVRGDTSRN